MTSPSTTPTRPPSQVRGLPRPVKVTVAVLFAAWCVDYVDRLVMSFALPHVAAEFALSATAQGAVLSAFSLSYAFAQIPGGVLADKVGAKRLVGAAMLTWSVMTALTGLAVGFASVLVVRLLFGIAQAVLPAATMKAIAERTTRETRMRANGLVLSSNAAGTLLATLLVPGTIALVGWRWTFGLAAVLGVLCFALVVRFLPTASPGDRSVAARLEPEVVQAASRAEIVALIRNRWMYYYVVMFFGVDVIVWGVLSWMPSYLEVERGLSPSGSGLALALPVLLMAVGTALGGRVTDALGGRPLLVVAPGMVLAGAALAVMASATSLTAFVALECVALFCVGMCFMPTMSVPLKGLSPALSGTGSSMVNFGGQLAGVVAPLAMGVLLDASGYQAAFLVLVAGALVALLASVLAPQTPEHLLQRMSVPPALQDVS